MNLNLFITQNGNGNVNTFDKSGEETKELLKLIRKIEREISVLREFAQVYQNKTEDKKEIIPLKFEQLN